MGSCYGYFYLTRLRVSAVIIHQYSTSSSLLIVKDYIKMCGNTLPYILIFSQLFLHLVHFSG